MWPPTHLCLAFTTCCCLCEGALAPCHVPAAPPPPPAVASQVAALAGGVDVLVAGPGRAAKLAASGHLNLNATRALVLDEVDVLCGGWLGMGKSARGKSARGKSAWEGCMGRVHGRGESAWWKSAWCAENAGCVCAGRWGAGPVVGSWGLVGTRRGIHVDKCLAPVCADWTRHAVVLTGGRCCATVLCCAVLQPTTTRTSSPPYEQRRPTPCAACWCLPPCRSM